MAAKYFGPNKYEPDFTITSLLTMADILLPDRHPKVSKGLGNFKRFLLLNVVYMDGFI